MTPHTMLPPTQVFRDREGRSEGAPALPASRQDADAGAGAQLLHDDWIALITHDLRAPINVVLMAAELLENGALEQERRDHWLAVIRAAAERMSTLVTDLLDTARLESGSSALDLHPDRLRPLLLQTLDAFQAVADRAGVRIAIGECSPELVGLVDPHSIVRVLGNLVDNAIRFTPAGGHVTIDARQTPAGVRLSVCDTGSGIHPDHLPHIFDRFWQAAHAQRGGAGLGLAIVSQIVEQHGGSIAVESEPGRGSRFHVLLPDAKRPADARRS